MQPIKGYESLYAVTENGEVYSYESRKFLRQSRERNGYMKVKLCKDGVQKTWLVHRLVADAFIPNPCNLPCVNHISENKLDNSVGNLEFCTHAYNNAYGTRIERTYKSVWCNELGKLFQSVKEAAEELSLDRSAIVKVCKGKKKSTHGYTFSYAEVRA